MQSLECFPEKFRRALHAFLQALEENFGNNLSVYLFGSLARGDYLLNSDIDLIIVTDRLKGLKPWERTAKLRRMAPEDVGLDILGYTEEEFQRAKKYLEPMVKIR
ncbi:nucleotidyltransferase domain-containing protein [Candidatus Bathyarchaeota archaeon]|nr:nucleotidyltransferase domain-containing protein [Candidatus Bathyarchaeota archaeon]